MFKAVPPALARGALASALIASSAAAAAVPQTPQFVAQPGPLPGPQVWTEKVLPVDADEDGEFDLLLVHAQGWSVPGDFDAPNTAKLPPTLLLKTGVSAGVANFVDASATYMPFGFALHGKSAAAGDVDADGHVDLLFAAAFGQQQPLLRKSPVTLAWRDESFRLPSLVANGFGVELADFDDDGDLDAIYAITGNATFGQPGGQPRLLINDGQGFFTDETFRLGGTVSKVGVQNAKVVDIDGDLDIDIIIDGKSPVTQLYLNSGQGEFTPSFATLPFSTASTGFSTYETEWADMDGDLDLDGMLMNANPGWKDAAVQSLLTDTGSLTFTSTINYLTTPNGQDENDFAFLDADDDGDLDVLVGALEGAIQSPSTPEKLLRNNGQFGNQFLSYVSGAFSGPPDSTLDLAVIDLDGDKRYDVVTVQGEFFPFQWRYYKNVGPVDSRPPKIPRVSPLSTSLDLALLQQGLPLRAWIYDAVIDDNQTYVTAELEWNSNGGGTGSFPMPHVGAYVHRAELSLSGAAVLGEPVTLTVRASDPYGQTSTALVGTTFVCGVADYGVDAGLSLAASGTPTPGQNLGLTVSGPAGSPGLLAISALPAAIPIGAGSLLVDLSGALLLPFVLDGAGQGGINLTVPAVFYGAKVYTQAGALDGQGGLLFSRGLKLASCLP